MNRKELWTKIGRQFIPNIGTIVVVLVLLWVQQAGALGSLSLTGSSATTISYQGRLADSGGAPVNDTVGMTFHIYNTATGGSPLWTETYPAVLVNDGLFHILLGSTTPLPQNLFSENSTLYLGITVGADDEMTPREQLASAPWAITVPDGSITTEKIADGSVTASKLQFVDWVDLTLASDFHSPPNADWQKAQYRKSGDVVYLRGLISSNSVNIVDKTVLATLPVDFCPPKAVAFVTEPHRNLETKHRVDIRPNCEVVINETAGDTRFVSFDGIMFSVTP